MCPLWSPMCSPAGAVSELRWVVQRRRAACARRHDFLSRVGRSPCLLNQSAAWVSRVRSGCIRSLVCPDQCRYPRPADIYNQCAGNARRLACVCAPKGPSRCALMTPVLSAPFRRQRHPACVHRPFPGHDPELCCAGLPTGAAPPAQLCRHAGSSRAHAPHPVLPPASAGCDGC